MSAATDFLENTLVDVLFRGQSATINGKTLSWSAAPTYYVRLCTVAGTDSSAGTEASGTDYAPEAVVASLTNFSGTQTAGSTTASTGTTGQTSNNAAVDFGTVGAGGWGNLVWWELWDASSGGNRLLGDYLRDVNGDPTTFSAVAGVDVTFTAGSLKITVA